jgi:thiamine pyrophosphokinase
MKCVIFANGPLKLDTLTEQAIQRHDLVLATDGGAVHCHSLGIKPDIVVGDMDSIPESLLTQLRQQGVEIFTFPQRKNQTDLELAIDLAIEREMEEITILGALGERWDMSIASIMLLATARFAKTQMTLRAGSTTLFCLRGPDRKQFAGCPGDRLSLIPISGPVAGVTLQGLEYPLTNHPIPLGSTLGISNIVTGPQVALTIQKGILLCVIERLREKASSPAMRKHDSESFS